MGVIKAARPDLDRYACCGGSSSADGLQAEGRVVVVDLLEHQPWPEAGAIDPHPLEHA